MVGFPNENSLRLLFSPGNTQTLGCCSAPVVQPPRDRLRCIRRNNKVLQNLPHQLFDLRVPFMWKVEENVERSSVNFSENLPAYRIHKRDTCSRRLTPVSLTTAWNGYSEELNECCIPHTSRSGPKTDKEFPLFRLGFAFDAMRIGDTNLHPQKLRKLEKNRSDLWPCTLAYVVVRLKDNASAFLLLCHTLYLLS